MTDKKTELIIKVAAQVMDEKGIEIKDLMDGKVLEYLYKETENRLNMLIEKQQ